MGIFTDTSPSNPIKWLWDFGDGGKSILQNPYHSYTRAGLFDVTLTISNFEGTGTVTNVAYIEVIAKPSTAFVADTTAAKPGDPIQFTDQSSGLPMTWRWEFGDGGISKVQNPSYVYARTGTYTVKLISRNMGGSDTGLKVSYIHIKN